MVGPFPPFRGGIANSNDSLANVLSKKHQVDRISFTTQYPGIFFPGKSQTEGDISKEIGRRILSSINPITWAHTAAHIVNSEPDLVIFRYWMPFFAPVFGGLSKRIKARSNTQILTICDNIVPHEKGRIDESLTRYFFNKVDFFMVMSKAVENDLVNLIPSAIYKYSPHPLYDRFGPILNKHEARKTLGIQEKNFILYFGLIRPYKGLDILIEASRYLKRQLEDVKIIAVGECYENENKYRKLVRQNGVDSYFDLRFEYVPEVDVATYFSAADLVVLPYKSATQSGIVPIAYHFDTPVVVTNVGGLPEIVPDGKAGYVVKGDPESVAGAIIRFFTNNKSAEFSAFIREYKKCFSWDIFAANLETLVRG